MIEFRQLNNLTEIITIHSVVPHQPQGLIKAAPSTLIYIDAGQAPTEVHWLYCEEAVPTADSGVKNITYKRQTGSLSCHAEDGNNQLLLFVSDSCNRIIAHNVEDGIIQWQAGDKLPGMEHPLDVRGIAADGRGHLFVCDFNNYAIQMFSVSDGQYLGCLIKEGEQSLGKPARISSCKMTSSLVVAHLVDRKWTISVIHLHY